MSLHSEPLSLAGTAAPPPRVSAILDLLTAEDLPPDIRLVHDACGMEVVKSLLAHLGGGRFYIPKPVSIAPLFERYIRSVMTNGGEGDCDARIIAARLGVSTEKVRAAARHLAER